MRKNLARPNKGNLIYNIFFYIKSRPRPKTKLPTLVETVPDMYPDLPFCDMSCKSLKIREEVVHQRPFKRPA